MAGPLWDSTEYHIEAIAEEMTRRSPEMQKMKQEMKDKVAKAVSSVQSNTRQNRTSADKEPMPPLRINDNPMGAHSGRKKGK